MRQCLLTEIFETICKAQKDALSLAKELDMVCHVGGQKHQIPSFITQLGKEPDICSEDTEEDSEQDDSDLTEDPELDLPHDVAEDFILHDQNQNNIPNDICLPKNSLFVVSEEGGKRSIIRKTTLLWSLTSKKHTLSSNRLERVKAAEERLHCQSQEVSHVVCRAENISHQEWVIFSGCPLPNRNYVGRILGFTYLSGSGKSREYSQSSAPIMAPDSNARGIGCLGDWYTLSCDGVGNLVKFHEPPTYLNIENYLCSVPRPTSVNGKMSYTATILSSIREILPNDLRDSQVSKTSTRKSSGRSMFPESDSEDDVSRNTVPSAKVSKTAKQILPHSTSVSEKRVASTLSIPPRTNASQIDTSHRRSPRRSVSPLPNSSTVLPPKKSFAPLDRNPEKGEFVLVEFEKKGTLIYYVAKLLLDVDDENDVLVSYLYLRRNVETSDTKRFAFPNSPDKAFVNMDAVKMILPKPFCSDSNPQKCFYQFDVSFDGFNVY
ncbi:hypothetical protein FOCC_FOCC014671 [Frankliniella occidentalis]|nr:hypothetical protein FOCC_FOCC014671 [Frankliniella occidentalis]